MSQVSETEAILFKPVPGGYLYQSANPWVFGSTTSHFSAKSGCTSMFASNRVRLLPDERVQVVGIEQRGQHRIQARKIPGGAERNRATLLERCLGWRRPQCPGVRT